MEAIKLFFKSGYLKPKYDIHDISKVMKSRSVTRYILNDSKLVIAFISNYPMLTRKNLDFIDWSKLVQLKDQNAHKTQSGLQNMRRIKLGLNRGRPFYQIKKLV